MLGTEAHYLKELSGLPEEDAFDVIANECRTNSLTSLGYPEVRGLPRNFEKCWMQGWN